LTRYFGSPPSALPGRFSHKSAPFPLLCSLRRVRSIALGFAMVTHVGVPGGGESRGISLAYDDRDMSLPTLSRLRNDPRSTGVLRVHAPQSSVVELPVNGAR
jgi:hypothetical protein